MIKFLLKLAATGLIGYAVWHIGIAYAGDYRFRDATKQAALTPRITDAQLRARVLDLAEENSVPLDEGSLEVRRASSHIFVDVSYEVPVDVLPWYERAWPFAWTVDVFVIQGGGLVPGPSSTPR